MEKEYYKYNNKLFKDLYYQELQFKERLINRISMPIGIITLIIGYTGFIYNQYIVKLEKISSNLIIGWLFTFLVLSILICIFFILKAIYGYEYRYIPSPGEIEKKMDELIKKYEASNLISKGITKEVLINEFLKRKIHKIIADATSNNREENKRRSKWIKRISWALIFSIFISTLIFGIFIIDNNAIKSKKNLNNRVININITILKGSENMLKKKDEKKEKKKKDELNEIDEIIKSIELDTDTVVEFKTSDNSKDEEEKGKLSH